MIDWASIIQVIYVINLVTIVILVCFRKDNPITTMAWVMLFILLPVVGGLIYLIFGVGISSYAMRRYRQKLEMNEEYILSLQKEAIKEYVADKKEHSDMINYFLNCSSVYTNGNSVKIFTDAKEKYAELIKDIKEAKESINVLYFIIRNDVIGNTLVNLLLEKAKEGVKVRLMYDGLGSFLTPKKIFNKLRKEKNCEVAEFFPVRFFSASKINHRNHRKIVVIDDKIAYTGGMNIGDEYMGRSKNKNLPWRDTHIRIVGEAVRYIQEYFALDWHFSTGKEVAAKPDVTESKAGNIGMQIVVSGPDSKHEEIKSGMLKMIYSARKYVYIQTPYFVPDQAFLTAVQVAAQSGVDVRVMIPGIPDKKYVYHTTMSYMDELLEHNVKVLLYPGFIHSKTITVDDELLTVGTTNIDIRSFKLLFEINAFMYSPHIAAEHRGIVEKDMEICHELTLEEYKKRGLIAVIKEGFFRLFSPIM